MNITSSYRLIGKNTTIDQQTKDINWKKKKEHLNINQYMRTKKINTLINNQRNAKFKNMILFFSYQIVGLIFLMTMPNDAEESRKVLFSTGILKE